MGAEMTSLERMTARLCALSLAEAAIVARSIEQLQAGVFQSKLGNAARAAGLRATGDELAAIADEMQRRRVALERIREAELAEVEGKS